MVNNKHTKYATIEDQTQHHEVSNSNDEQQPPNQQSSSRLMLIKKGAVLISFIGALALLIASTTPHSTDDTAEIPMMGILRPTVRDCTFDECFASNCDMETAPFTCELHNGGPHGGCSPTPWIEDTCDDQCNLKACASLIIPDSVQSCEGVECSKEWCTTGQLCGIHNQYQCTDGSARFGCSQDDLEWTLRTAEVVCSKCCDVTTC